MHVVYISICMVLLVASANADPQEVEGIPIRIAGSALNIAQGNSTQQCTGITGFCVGEGERCNGTVSWLHNSCNDYCTCCVPAKQGAESSSALAAPREVERSTFHISGPARFSFVPTAEQCTGKAGFCVGADERCNGTLKFLHRSCDDLCSCCIPDNQGSHQAGESVAFHIGGPVRVFTGSSAGQCIKGNGFCIDSGETCNGEIKLLQNSGNDHCTCCQGSNSTNGTRQEQEGLRIHVTGSAQVIYDGSATTTEQCTAGAGFCVSAGESCNGTTKMLHSSGNDHCTCCVPANQVPTAEQCTGRDGFCIQAGERCNGTISFLHNFFDDHCTCCAPEGCPEGFFKSEGSKQCFKPFRDAALNWNDAKKKCESEGLTAAKPSDGVAVALRKDLLDTHGKGHFWLDARGDGSKMVWQRDGTELSSDSSLWQPGQPGTLITSSNCLSLSVKESSWSRYPDQPYHSAPSCTLLRFTLCEAITE